MRPALPFALIAVAFAGCSPPGGFSRMSNPQLRFENASGQVRATLEYDDSQGCTTLGEDASATVNGERISLFPGDSVANFFPPREFCRFPELSFNPPALVGEDAVLIIRSGGEEVDVDIQGVGTTLSGHPVLAPGEAIHAGDLIHVALDSGFDRAIWSEALGPAVTDSRLTRSPLSLSSPVPEGVLDVQLPGDLAAGRAHLQAGLRLFPSFTGCQGPVACIWEPSLLPLATLDVAFDVAP